LVGHRKPCEIYAESVDEARLVRTVDECVRLANPELVHGGPVVHDDSALVPKDTLVHRRTNVPSPLREDRAVILATPPTQLVQVSDKWKARW
jgi:hypothetical protein